ATGWYGRPTLFSGANNDMRIAREEIFGPVLTVDSFRDEDEAIRIANDTEYGLAGSVFTADTDRGYGVAARVRSGTFGVNEGDILGPAGAVADPPPVVAVLAGRALADRHPRVRRAAECDRRVGCRAARGGVEETQGVGSRVGGGQRGTDREQRPARRGGDGAE